MTEWYEDLWEERNVLAATQQVRTLTAAEYERFKRVCAILGAQRPGRTGDPEIDAFERAIEEGKTVDLSEWKK